MNPILQTRADEIVRQFQALPDWEARYRLVIDLGKALPALPEALRTEEVKVKGCQSQVWLHASLDGDRVIFQADSDALIVKGLVALLVRVYSGVTPQDILSFPPEFLKQLGFEGNLTPSRANGLHSMLKQIRNYAVAFDYLLKNQKTH